MTSIDCGYLRPDVVIEPLIHRWYAWTYLVPPHCASMFTRNAHLRMMSSFVASPEVHVQALASPEMMGGPFINYAATETEAVRALVARTETAAADLIELADGIRSLEELLAGHETGTSLEPLYARLPETLRGFVELTFDMRHRPDFRFIEPLLYRSRFWKEESQSFAVQRVASEHRSFVFSTPRLDRPDIVMVAKPFRDAAIDVLGRAREAAANVDEVAERCGIRGREERLAFDAMFVPRSPSRSSHSSPESGIRVRYFGHACVCIETDKVCILVDPLIPGDVDDGIDKFVVDDLPARVDFVLLTHAHQDHVLLETLLPLRTRIETIVVARSAGGSLVDPSLALLLRKIGFSSVVELDEFETIELDGGTLIGLPFFGEHGDLAIRTKLTYAVTLGGRTLVFAADSNNFAPELYRHVARELGRVDMLFLGMECDGAPMSWLYGPLFTRPIPRRIDDSRRTNGSDAVRGIALVDALRPRSVVVYAMAQEPWCRFLTSVRYQPTSKPIVESNRLVAVCRERGLSAERVFGRAEWRIA